MRLFDIHSLNEAGEIELWFKDGVKVEREVESFNPRFYVLSSKNEMEKLKNDLNTRTEASKLRYVEKKPWLRKPRKKMLKIEVERLSDLWNLATQIYEKKGFRDSRLFNIDLSTPFRYLLRKNLYPTIHVGNQFSEDQWTLHYTTPEIKKVEIDINPGHPINEDKKIEEAVIGDKKIVKKEEKILLKIKRQIKNQDPDVIYTTRSKVLPHLFNRAKKLGLEEFYLGRKPGPTKRKEKVYRSYGRTVHKPPSLLSQRQDTYRQRKQLPLQKLWANRNNRTFKAFKKTYPRSSNNKPRHGNLLHAGLPSTRKRHPYTVEKTCP